MGFFTTGAPPSPPPTSPGVLFRDLRRHNSVKFLWGHQQETLEGFHRKYIDSPNVALELPTGSGKTLVGLLIAEFRRRAHGLRVAFLCPTKQLAVQIHKASQRYGIGSVLLIGAQKNWSATEFSRYQRAETVAITTYSAVFNTNPKLDDAELLICDDAHAADQFIGNLWTVSIKRRDDEAAFMAMARTLSPLLSDAMSQCISADRLWAYNVDLISSIAIQEAGIRLKETLDAVVSGDYAYSMIGDALHACNVYASAAGFDIAPVTPPTRFHAPFAGAKQRVYMSATLGDDGSIERAFGIKKLARLPIPDGWDTRGTGRRLLLFPGLAQSPSGKKMKQWEIAHDIVQNGTRSLVLVPSGAERDRVAKVLEKTHSILGAADVEQDLGAFTSRSDQVALVLANRFDGIDLPGDECRLMVVDGLPDAAGLQETYLVYRLGASALMRDRVRTRLTQAIGRCTRDESDYAAVLILGDDLLKWFSTKPNVQGMHPEIQAEIKFGFDNSDNRPPEDFATAVDLLLGQSGDWIAAEEGIKARRATFAKVPDAEAKALSESAPHEIEYQYALWESRLDDALACASAALDALSGGTELKAYRSFWHHQAAVAAYLAWKTGGDQAKRRVCMDQLSRASATSAGMKWLGRLQTALASEVEAPDQPFPAQSWYNEVSGLLQEWGLRGPKFKERVHAAESLWGRVQDSTSVDLLIEATGRMLGFRTQRFTGVSGAPDGLWWIDDAFGFVFESKLGAVNPEISIDDLRQASTHASYVRSVGIVPQTLPLLTVLISNQNKLRGDARSFASDYAHVNQAEFRALFSSAATALERARVLSAEQTEDGAREAILNVYADRGITPQFVAVSLRTRRVDALL